VTRNYFLSRYGMVKTAHAIRRQGSRPVGMQEPAPLDAPVRGAVAHLYHRDPVALFDTIPSI